MSLKLFLGSCAILFGLYAVVDALIAEKVDDCFSDLRMAVRDEARATVLAFIPPSPDGRDGVDGV